jgi:class 3 adenylate cyclase
MAHQPGGSVARGFLFADLRGYSAFVERFGDRAGAELLQTYRTLVRSSIASFHRAEIRTEGDSFYLVFGSPSDAVLCGRAILDAARQTKTASGHGIAVGIGVHAGETVTTDEGYVGSVVNIAARVCAAAQPGELLVTDAVRALTRTYLDVGFIPAGRRRLKGISEPIALYRVVASGQAAGRAAGLNSSSSRRFVAVAGAVFAVLAVLAVALALSGATPFLGDPPQNNASATSPTPPPDASMVAASPAGTDASAYPNAAERALLGRIDESVARLCERPEPDEIPVVVYGAAERAYSGPLAVESGLRCQLGSPSEPDTVWFWLFIESWAADEFFFSTAGSRSVPPGDCPTEDRAHGSWEFGALGGRILCIAGSRDARLYWTYDDERVLGFALRGDGDVRTLYRWWRERARTLGVADS